MVWLEMFCNEGGRAAGIDPGGELDEAACHVFPQLVEMMRSERRARLREDAVHPSLGPQRGPLPAGLADAAMGRQLRIPCRAPNALPAAPTGRPCSREARGLDGGRCRYAHHHRRGRRASEGQWRQPSPHYCNLLCPCGSAVCGRDMTARGRPRRPPAPGLWLSSRVTPSAGL